MCTSSTTSSTNGSLHAIAAALLCAALLTALPAGAQMYKWIDERGVITYSNAPPPESAQAKKVVAVADRVSVYTPDPVLTRAMTADPRRDAKIESLERQLEAERRAAAYRPAVTASRQSAYERCVSERRVDCETMRPGAAPYYPADSYGGYYAPVYAVGVARGAVLSPAQPFQVLSVPVSIIGINNAPPAGISTAPPVGIDNRPPVGAPPRARATRVFR